MRHPAKLSNILANTKVERFMQPLMGKTITAAYIEHQNWKNYFQEYLMNYRITPHPAAKILPSQMVNNRDIKFTISQV